MMSKEIHNDKWIDVLNWGKSPLSKDKDYHITPREGNLIQKLIDYSSENKFITHSNATIGEHMFLSEETIKTHMNGIKRKGFLIIYTKKQKIKGKMVIKRSISLNWDLLEKMLNDSHIINKQELKDEMDKQLYPNNKLNDCGDANEY